MFEILLKSVEDLERKDQSLIGNYQKFQKDYEEYQENINQYGFGYKASDEELFGLPYEKVSK
jgi:hypothetical protein